MLERLLTLIAAADEVTSVDGLARAMGVSRALAERLMGDLVRMGHLRLVHSDCATATCSSCPMRSDCGPSIGLWELTEKGRRAIAKSPVI
jgi:predicted ArsR family transcriptional regulator